ncbi:RNA-binding region RNP-1 domain-containing protein [Blastocystis sp. ATCC 50177/Nand II]|uniref:RNA-binding region RNP-1 domain-containing protein n=1 Tax=Blastocystis sp. subtype 1 (strain ATCC 50177 / NandII) TaxID=478820 RepID=A0A196SGG3_BLAHN|nr:RNA-binding region RNP-1 domain-containing protein [Blastocystis sp. ATCC 50177/Nand II]
MNGVQFRGHAMYVRFSTTNYVDPVSGNTCPSIRDLTEDYYGKIVHRFNSLEYAQIPWHMPSRKLHVVGFDNTNPNIKSILFQLFGNVGKVESVCVLKNMAWIEMESVESATNAIATIHNTSLYTLVRAKESDEV